MTWSAREYIRNNFHCSKLQYFLCAVLIFLFVFELVAVIEYHKQNYYLDSAIASNGLLNITKSSENVFDNLLNNKNISAALLLNNSIRISPMVKNASDQRGWIILEPFLINEEVLKN